MRYTTHQYDSLIGVLGEALNQAVVGKGAERHAEPDEPFEKQVICEAGMRLGEAGPLYQAIKKIYESRRLEGEAGVKELLGAINYIAGAIVVRRQKERKLHG